MAVPAVVRGVDSPAKETATEVSVKASNASIRFDVKMLLFEDMGIKRLISLMDLNNQQFFTQPRLIKLFDVDQAMSWQMVDPLDVIGEWDYRPAGAAVDPAANKEVRRQQLMMLAEYAAKTQSPYIKRLEIEKELVRSFDLRNPEKFIKTEEELQAEAMQAQLQQEQLAQAEQSKVEQQFGQKIAEKIIDRSLQGGDERFRYRTKCSAENCGDGDDRGMAAPREPHQRKIYPGHQATLERGDFNDLLAVGRAQGAIAELKKVFAFVEKCQEKIKNEE